MATPVFFPTITAEGGILCSISLKKGSVPGLYPEEISLKNKSFRDGLSHIVLRWPILLAARAYDPELITFEGSSASGCFAFFDRYDIDTLESSLNIAISVHYDLANGRTDGAMPVSDADKKVSLCIDEHMDVLVLSEKNRRDAENIPEVLYCSLDEELSRLRDALEKIRKKESGEKLLVLWANNNWMEKLAALLELKKRKDSESEDGFSVAGDTAQGTALYELYISALTEDDEDKALLRDLFRRGAPSLGNIPMTENTFPWEVMWGKCEQGKPYRDFVFKAPSLIFSGPTSTGKTTLAKALMLHALVKEQTLYIAPTRALVYEVYEDFLTFLDDVRKLAEELDKEKGENVSTYGEIVEALIGADNSDLILSTGERNERDGQILRGDYRIIFSVYEKANLFMNMMAYQTEGHRPNLVIIDELHMLCDEDRGGIVDLFLAKSLSMEQQQQQQLRVVGITTESGGAETIRCFLNHREDPPAVLSIKQRPLPVTHYLTLGDNHVRIARLDGEDCVVPEKDRRRIAKKLETREDVKFDCSVMLTSKDPETGKAHKKVIGVINSISRIYEEVERLSKIREEADGNFCDDAIVKDLNKVLDNSFINEGERKILRRGIKSGIFVYYSPLDYYLREAMARAFRQEAGETQVLLTTEALAYGVNFPADAIYLTYIRGSDNFDSRQSGGEYLKRNLFFNILGRAGRLGKSSNKSVCSAFVVLSGKGIPLKKDIYHILDMYEQTSSFKARTLDESTEKGILVGDTVRSLDDISFTSFRSALDALRFVALKESQKRAAVTNVRNFFEHSLYGWQFCSHGEHAQRRAELERMLSRIYELIFDAEQFEKNKLVERIRYDDKTFRYSCTDLASALIDTGTSWKAIGPMHQWLQYIKNFSPALPVELLLVGMLSVEELWSSIRSFDTLSKSRDVSTLSTESHERAQDVLRQELLRLLPQERQDDADEIMRVISEYVLNACGELILSPGARTPLDHITRLNSFSRLLAALFAWARGASSDEIQKFASPGKDAQDFAVSFSPRYGERICWLCLLCLRFFSKTREIRLCPEHESALQNLAMRMYYGVPEDCIPLLGVGKKQLSRTLILKYRNKYGISLQNIMQQTFKDYAASRNGADVLIPNEYDKLQDNAVNYYCRAALDFCNLLMRGKISDSIKNALETLRRFFKNYSSFYRKPHRDREQLLGIMNALQSMLNRNIFKAELSSGRLIIKRKGDSESLWELVIFLLDPSDKERKVCTSKGSEGICVWMPWNINSDSVAYLPAVNLMSLVLLLRQLEDIDLGSVRSWIRRQKENNESGAYLRIQQLISESPDAVEGLRASLPGDILQGVLQMEEPVFTSCKK